MTLDFSENCRQSANLSRTSGHSIDLDLDRARLTQLLGDPNRNPPQVHRALETLSPSDALSALARD